MPKIVAGMGIADMDFECVPVVTEALQKRISHHNWGYEMLDMDLILGTGGNHPSSRASSTGTTSATAST